jgi:ABC-2 type transport system permease protein
MSWQPYLWSTLASARITGMLLLRRRRVLFLGVLVLIPALLPVLVSLLRTPHTDPPWGLTLFALIAEYGFLSTLVPLGAILLGTALVGDDLEHGTAPYLLTRSAPRSSIVLGKFAAYTLVMACAVLPALGLTLLSAALTAPGSVDVGAGLGLLARTSGVLCLAIVLYGALCGTLGTLTRRPVIYAVVFVFGWEPLTRIVPGYVDFLTLKKHLLALWPRVVLGEGLAGGRVEIARKVIDVGVGEALAALGLSLVALTAVATLTLRTKEFARGQSMA